MFDVPPPHDGARGTPGELAAHPDRRLRLTLGPRREDDRWLVAHEHHSSALESPGT